jgi:DNA-binding NarL/FixJ family response regulator
MMPNAQNLVSSVLNGGHDNRAGSPSVHQDYGISDYLALVDRRMLERECLAQALTIHRLGMRVVTFENLEALSFAQGSLGLPRAVLVNAGSGIGVSDGRLEAEISEIVAAVAPVPVVVLSENQDLSDVLNIIALGVRGYIPSSVSVDVCLQAIGLAIVGGKFVPASSVMNVRRQLGVGSEAETQTGSHFTERQSAVADALCRGKANKDIAVELDLSESTVKVHVRNIMRKLGATNRTQVAYKIGGTEGGNPT